MPRRKRLFDTLRPPGKSDRPDDQFDTMAPEGDATAGDGGDRPTPAEPPEHDAPDRPRDAERGV